MHGFCKLLQGVQDQNLIEFLVKLEYFPSYALLLDPECF